MLVVERLSWLKVGTRDLAGIICMWPGSVVERLGLGFRVSGLGFRV